MTLEPVCKDVETAQGVPITVTGVAQVNKFILNFDLNKIPNKYVGLKRISLLLEMGQKF